MHRKPCPVIVLPSELSEEAAAALLALLQEMIRALERHHADQPRRHHPDPDRQLPLWPEHGPPF